VPEGVFRPDEIEPLADLVDTTTRYERTERITGQLFGEELVVPAHFGHAAPT